MSFNIFYFLIWNDFWPSNNKKGTNISKWWAVFRVNYSAFFFSREYIIMLFSFSPAIYRHFIIIIRSLKIWPFVLFHISCISTFAMINWIIFLEYPWRWKSSWRICCESAVSPAIESIWRIYSSTIFWMTKSNNTIKTNCF